MMLTNISRDYFIEIQQTSFGTRTEKGKQTLQVGYFFATGKQPSISPDELYHRNFNLQESTMSFYHR